MKGGAMENRLSGQKGVFFSQRIKDISFCRQSCRKKNSGCLQRYRRFAVKKVLYALRDYLVLGYERKEVCARYDVSSSYFSIALGRISHVNRVVYSLAPYYADPGNDFFDRPYQ